MNHRSPALFLILCALTSGCTHPPEPVQTENGVPSETRPEETQAPVSAALPPQGEASRPEERPASMPEPAKVVPELRNETTQVPAPAPATTTEASLSIPTPEADLFGTPDAKRVRVRAFLPDGRPATGLSFTSGIWRGKYGYRAQDVAASEVSPGSYLVPTYEPPSAETDDVDAEHWIAARIPELGTARSAVRPGKDREVSLQFATPSWLTLRVSPRPSKELADRLQATIASRPKSGLGETRKYAALKDAETFHLGPLETGVYAFVVAIALEDGTTIDLATGQVEVLSKEAEIKISLPELFALEVSAKETLRNPSVVLTPLATGTDASRIHELNAEGRTRFDFLLKGRYRVTIPGLKDGSTEIDVPPTHSLELPLPR